MTLWLWVFLRIVANPFSNVFQKILTRKTADPLSIICIPLGLLAIASLPALVWLPPLHRAFWLNISICTVLAVLGNTLLVEAVKRSDLSVLGPINAYKSVVSLLPGMLLLGEVPRPAGLAGIALIVAGSYFILDKNVSEPRRNVFVRFFRDRGIQFRFAALFFSAIEAVFLKKALRASNPLATFVFWSILGFGLSAAGIGLLFTRAKMADQIATGRANWKPFLMLGLTTALMQLGTLITFEALQVGYSLALFQTSTLLSVFLGHRLFREGHFLERLIGSIIMMAGAALIIVAGAHGPS